jgi:hypothetical protein
MKPRLMQLFMNPEGCNMATMAHEAAREEGLAAALAATVRLKPTPGGWELTVAGPKGVVRFEGTSIRGTDAVIIEFYPATRVIRRRFWMNRSSVKEMLDRLATLPETNDLADLFGA